MTRSRRKKILTWTLLIVLLLLSLGYAFRYPLIRKYQYMKLDTLYCADSVLVPGNEKKNCGNRIWAHRVNTQERYDILKDRFHGFETDIVYEDSTQTFYVYHPPRPEDGDVQTLKDFLIHTDVTDSNAYHMFWLDTRGVDSSNMQRAVDAMTRVLLYVKDSIENSLFTGYQMFIELYDLTTARFFAENGLIVTFDPPEPLLKQMMTDSLLRDSVSRSMGRIAFVSQDYRNIPHLKKFFPDRMILTWRPEFEVFTNTKELQQLLDDPHVGVVLVSIKTRYYK